MTISRVLADAIYDVCENQPCGLRYGARADQGSLNHVSIASWRVAAPSHFRIAHCLDNAPVTCRQRRCPFRPGAGANLLGHCHRVDVLFGGWHLICVGWQRDLPNGTATVSLSPSHVTCIGAPAERCNQTASPRHDFPRRVRARCTQLRCDHRPRIANKEDEPDPLAQRRVDFRCMACV